MANAAFFPIAGPHRVSGPCGAAFRVGGGPASRAEVAARPIQQGRHRKNPRNQDALAHPRQPSTQAAPSFRSIRADGMGARAPPYGRPSPAPSSQSARSCTSPSLWSWFTPRWPRARTPRPAKSSARRCGRWTSRTGCALSSSTRCEKPCVRDWPAEPTSLEVRRRSKPRLARAGCARQRRRLTCPPSE